MTSYITGISASTSTQAGHFIDNLGQPKMYVTDWAQGMLTNIGRYSSGNWQSDIDTYFSYRSAQGLTVHHDVMINCVDGAANLATGGTWDGVAPFNSGGDPTTGLNNTFWTRVDYMISSAASHGITVAWSIGLGYNWPTGRPYGGWTTAQFTAFCTAIGARYPSSTHPNILWLFGDDQDPGVTSIEDNWDTMLTALRANGANQPVSVEWETETTSRYDPNTGSPTSPNAATWGVNNAAYEIVYTYQIAYWMMEFAWKDVTFGSPALLTPVQIDGEWYQGSGSSYYAPTDRQMRQEWWWTLTSGGRGFMAEANNVYAADNSSWLSNAQTDWVFANNMGNIAIAFASWTNWYLLVPDLSSAFITAGRGTHAAFTTAQYGETFTNTWVTASITPDGTLAVAYLSNHTTITCTTSMLAAGWTAQWVDPITCATSSAGSGPTFNSTAKGSNSQGDPDWVLLFQAPSAATVTPSAVAGPAGIAPTVIPVRAGRRNAGHSR